MVLHAMRIFDGILLLPAAGMCCSTSCCRGFLQTIAEMTQHKEEQSFKRPRQFGLQNLAGIPRKPLGMKQTPTAARKGFS